MWIDVAFIFLGYSADLFLRMIFPIDTSFSFLIFVPNLGFLAFLLVSLKKTLPVALTLALILGLSVDLMSHEMIGNLLAYPITVYVIKLWSHQFNDSLFEQVFMGTIGLFLKEFIFYLVLFTIGITRLTIVPWFVKREFITLIGHVPLLLSLCLLNRVRINLQNNLDHQKQRRERVLSRPTLKP